MLTATYEPKEIELTQETQNETLPSDLEILRRVTQIKSEWTPTECIRRRREAKNRFAELMSKLDGEAA